MAVKTFKTHQNAPTGTHKKSQILLIIFSDEYRSKDGPTNKVFDSVHKGSIKKATEAISTIADTLCGRQNISLRAHRDSTKLNVLNNSENFVERLIYRVTGGDKTFENHLQNALQNAKYTSPDIQNELIKCCKDLIMEQLAGEVKKSRYY